MGWTDSHLHEYEIAQRRYGAPDDEDEDEWPSSEPVADEQRVHLKTAVEAGARRFTDVYDFGDHWEHAIHVEDNHPVEIWRSVRDIPRR
jgi:hypothetical protein